MATTSIKTAKQAEIVGEKTNNNMKKGQSIHITTHLMGKEEVFKMLALAHAAKLPVLLVGEPGVAKTNTVLDYAATGYDLSTVEGLESYENDVYILETDEGTKSTEIKGRLNMREFVQNQNWSMNTPAANAKYVVINEVDKASSGMRNSLLGMMNEKVLFNGEAKVPCQWKLFVATCNEIPKDEVGSPFWDRFILKMKVTRMSQALLEKYFNSGDKKYTENYTLYIPTEEEINAVKLPGFKLKAFLNLAYKDLSDRTLSYVPRLVKIASLVYNTRIDSALVKVASILIGEHAANTLSKSLITPEMKTIFDKIDLIPGIKDKKQYDSVMEEVNLLINSFRKSNKLNDDQIMELREVLKEVETNSPFGLELVDDTEEE